MSESISGRDFFNFRFFVPGFVFVMLIFSINMDLIPNLLNIFLSKLDASAILALVTFLSSSAFGFLVVQIYYVMVDCQWLGCILKHCYAHRPNFLGGTLKPIEYLKFDLKADVNETPIFQTNEYANKLVGYLGQIVFKEFLIKRKWHPKGPSEIEKSLFNIDEHIALWGKLKSSGFLK